MNRDEIKKLFLQEVDNLSSEFPFLSRWLLKFDNAKKRAGMCNASTKSIHISSHHYLNNSFEMVKDTVLHELAHAITFELYSDLTHGERWKSIAVRIGAKPKATAKFNLPHPPWFLVSVCYIQKSILRIAPRYRRNKNIVNYFLKGRPSTKGSLYYVKYEELMAFENGVLPFEKLVLIS